MLCVSCAWEQVLLIKLLLISVLSPSDGDTPVPITLDHCQASDVYGRFNEYTSQSCQTVLFTPTGALGEHIMRNFAAMSGLAYGTDVKGVAEATFFEYWSDNFAGSDIVIQLDTAGGAVGNASSSLSYTLWYNHSMVRERDELQSKYFQAGR